MTRQLVLTAIGTVITTALCASPAAAAAGGGSVCAKTATVSTGTVLDLSHSGDIDGSGRRQLDQTAVHELRRGTSFLTKGRATLWFGGFRYIVAADSIVDLGCSGHAGGPANLPSLNVEMGSASVKTGGASTYGTLATSEMLLDPYADKAMGVTLARTPKGDPTVQDVVNVGPSALRFGKAVARQSGHHGAYLNITPYIGAQRRTNGLCHQAHGATITSSAIKGGSVQGTVRYRSLAPFSPR